MEKISKTQTVYNFRNTCHNCFNDIEIPLLGDFAYGELIFQTKDAKDFYIAVLINNKTFDFVLEVLKHNKYSQNIKTDPQKILVLIADKVNDKAFTTDFPICPNCKSRLRHFNADNRSSQIELGFVTWTDFERLSQENKLNRLQEVVNY